MRADADENLIVRDVARDGVVHMEIRYLPRVYVWLSLFHNLRAGY